MTASTVNTGKLFASLDETWNELIGLIASTTDKSINAIPFKDSWTAAQLATHVTKSNKAIAQGLQMEGKLAERDPEQGVVQIRKMFLDFEAKYKSPEFIVPEEKEYDKDEVVKAFGASINKLRYARNEVNLSEIINLPIFGEVTKLELLYFVLYHTQRHIHQLKKIIKGFKED